MLNLKRGGRWPVILNLGNDVIIADKQTLEWDCQCGALLELAHLQDMDTLRLWYGGFCGQCGRELDVESDDDTLHCRECDTPLVFDSDREYEEHMHCPACHPELNPDKPDTNKDSFD